MKFLAIPLIMTTFVNVTEAADYGVGVSFNNDSSTIYLPVDISKKLRIEPSLGVTKFSGDDRSQDGYQNDLKNLQLLVGVFGKSQISENISTYYGGRIGYIINESSSSYNDNNLNKTELNGYSIEPAFGFEYHFVPRISLGGENKL